MEPRPPNKPQRQAPVPPASPPPIDRSNWVPPQSTVSSGYPQANLPPVPNYGSASAESTGSRGLWYDPAIPTGPPQGPAGSGGYSPGPALTPIDSGPIAKIIGPLLALLVLAGVVTAIVFVVIRVFDGGDGRDNNQATGGTTTAVSQAAPTEAATEENSGDDEESKETKAAIGVEKTAGPTEEGSTAEAGEPENTPKPTDKPEPTSAPSSALALLPTTEDAPEGFQRTEKDKRTKEAVASSFPNADEAMANLDEWEWKENAYITFEIPVESNPDPNQTTYINVSIHRFGDKTSTKAALAYFSDSVTVSQGLEPLSVERIGDQTVGLSGAPDGSNLVVLYVRTGNFLIRIGGSSPTGDPAQDVIDLAKKIVG